MIVRRFLAHNTLFRLLIGERDIADNGRQFPLMGSVDQIVTSLPARRGDKANPYRLAGTQVKQFERVQ